MQQWLEPVPAIACAFAAIAKLRPPVKSEGASGLQRGSYGGDWVTRPIRRRGDPAF
jgi:hypothetical protein